MNAKLFMSEFALFLTLSLGISNPAEDFGAPMPVKASPGAFSAFMIVGLHTHSFSGLHYKLLIRAATTASQLD